MLLAGDFGLSIYQQQAACQAETSTLRDGSTVARHRDSSAEVQFALWAIFAAPLYMSNDLSASTLGGDFFWGVGRRDSRRVAGVADEQGGHRSEPGEALEGG